MKRERESRTWNLTQLALSRNLELHVEQELELELELEPKGDAMHPSHGAVWPRPSPPPIVPFLFPFIYSTCILVLVFVS